MGALPLSLRCAAWIIWGVGTPYGSGSFGVTIAPGTSPSEIQFFDGGQEIAVNGANDHLWTTGTLTNGDTGLPMAASTSPSIAGTATTLAGFIPVPDYDIAYMSNTATLSVYNARFGNTSLGVVMASNTSTSVVALRAQ
jgi:hypothetical protein